MRSDDADVISEKDYPVGDNIDIVRVKSRKLSCRCEEPQTKDQQPGESELLPVLCRVGIQFRLRFDNTVYDELVSTGRLDIIEYIELTRSLKTYWTVQVSRAQGLAQLAPVNRQTFNDIEEFIFWQPALPGGDYANCLFDFEKFETNNKAASLIAQAQRIQYSYFLGYQEILLKLTEVREALNRGYPEIVAAANESPEDR